MFLYIPGCVANEWGDYYEINNESEYNTELPYERTAQF
jgi:hypothetical protein